MLSVSIRRLLICMITLHTAGFGMLQGSEGSGFPQKGGRSAQDVASFSKAIGQKRVSLVSSTKVLGEALQDTTSNESQLPEDLPKKYLARDITVFVIVSAFVAYFIIKVFLEGETEIEPPPSKGKDVPIGGLSEATYRN